MLKMLKSDYITNKLIFRIGALIWILLLAFTIYIEGFSILQKTYEYKCSTYYGSCDFIIQNGSNITINSGETFYFNKHDPFMINLLNYGTLLLLVLCFGINHYLYNKGKIKKIFKGFKDEINK